MTGLGTRLARRFAKPGRLRARGRWPRSGLARTAIGATGCGLAGSSSRRPPDAGPGDGGAGKWRAGSWDAVPCVARGAGDTGGADDNGGAGGKDGAGIRLTVSAPLPAGSPAGKPNCSDNSSPCSRTDTAMPAPSRRSVWPKGWYRLRAFAGAMPVPMQYCQAGILAFTRQYGEARTRRIGAKETLDQSGSFQRWTGVNS